MKSARRRFFCDDHLLKLCRWLRAAGYDVAWERAIDDGLLVARARTEGRIVLTLDREIERRRLAEGIVHVLSSHDPLRQLEEVVRAWELDLQAHPFTRCTVCNVELEAGTDEMAPPRVKASYTEYQRCPTCGRTYWEGTHVQRLRGLFARVAAPHAPSSVAWSTQRDEHEDEQRPPDQDGDGGRGQHR